MTRVKPTIAGTAVRSQGAPNRRLRHWFAHNMRWFERPVRQSARRCQADRYRKHFLSSSHSWLLLFHGLGGFHSLRESYAMFEEFPDLMDLSGLMSSQGTTNVSFSQYASSNTTRPAAFLGGTIPKLMQRVRRAKGSVSGAVPVDWRIVDTTFIRLSMKLAPWIRAPTTQPGIKVQVEYTPALDLPEHLVITKDKANDHNRLDEAILDNAPRLQSLCGCTLILDLGYYSHVRFKHLSQAKVHWVTRLKKKAKVQVDEELPLPQPLPFGNKERITILAHQRITLGSANNRTGAVLPNICHIRARVEPLPKAAKQGAKVVVYELITDRWDLTAHEVVYAYLARWQIELFFRWLKSHVHIKHLIGYSENAVQFTIYLAIIIHLFCVLAADYLGRARRWPALVRRLGMLMLTLDQQSLALPEAYQLGFPDWGLPPTPT